jgi:hypothetical protein
VPNLNGRKTKGVRRMSFGWTRNYCEEGRGGGDEEKYGTQNAVMRTRDAIVIAGK